jgi:hypothetical protein
MVYFMAKHVPRRASSGPALSEGSGWLKKEILRCAQNDILCFEVISYCNIHVL